MTAVQTADTPLPRRPFIEKAPLERYVAPEKPSLVGLSRAALVQALDSIGVPPAQHRMRLQQLWHWLYVRGATGFDRMTNVSKQLRAALDAHFTLQRPEVVAEQLSVDGTRKWLLRLPGEQRGARTRSSASISPKPTAARSASPARSAARSPARSAIPARSGWCATSRPARSSARSWWRATGSATGRNRLGVDAMKGLRVRARCRPAPGGTGK